MCEEGAVGGGGKHGRAVVAKGKGYADSGEGGAVGRRGRGERNEVSAFLRQVAPFESESKGSLASRFQAECKQL